MALPFCSSQEIPTLSAHSLSPSPFLFITSFAFILPSATPRKSSYHVVWLIVRLQSSSFSENFVQAQDNSLLPSLLPNMTIHAFPRNALPQPSDCRWLVAIIQPHFGEARSRRERPISESSWNFELHRKSSNLITAFFFASLRFWNLLR